MSQQWIAEDPVHVVVRTEGPAVYDTKGRMVQQKQRRVFAKFQRGGIPPFALDIATKTFEFRKKPPEVPLENWAGFYDLETDTMRNGWTEEEQAAIAERLDSAYIRIEKPKQEAPYANYVKNTTAVGKRTLEAVVARVLNDIEELGIEPGVVLAFERDNPRKESAAITAAVESLGVEESEDEPLIAA